MWTALVQALAGEVFKTFKAFVAFLTRPILASLGTLAREQGHVSSSILLFQAVHALRPDTASAFDLGRAWRERSRTSEAVDAVGDLDAAVHVLQGARRDAPETVEVRFLLCECLLARLALHVELEDWQAALADSEALFELGPSHLSLVRVHADRALAQFRQGDVEAALST